MDSGEITYATVKEILGKTGKSRWHILKAFGKALKWVLALHFLSSNANILTL